MNIRKGSILKECRYQKGRGRFLSVLMFAIALMCCLGAVVYPLLGNYLYDRRQDQIIIEYEKDVEHADASALDAEREACYEYNRKIRQVSNVVTNDQSGHTQYNENEWFRQEEYESRLNLSGNGVMGHIIIPGIGVNLPVSHYATTAVLDSGVGHLPESSLPVGGKGSHAVLTGHTGGTDRVIFTDLDRLTAGDHFFMSVLGEILVYEVDQILTVLPHQVDDLMIDQEKDYMTLVTCTPYGINSHRLLVRGHRIDPSDELFAELEMIEGDIEGAIDRLIADEKEERVYSAFEINYVKALLIAGAASAVIILIYLFYMRKKCGR